MSHDDDTQQDPEAGGSGPAEVTGGEHDEAAAPPRGVRAMALVRWVLIAGMAVVAALSVAYSLGLVAPETASASATQYYCPMHPQVVQDHPGECPICSMSLVPRTAAPAPSAAKGPPASKPRASHEGHRHEPSDPYFCPMHPEETGTSEDARCPLCKMKLEKRADGAPSSGAPSAQGVPGLAPVELAMDRVQLIGMRTAKATGEQLAPELRAVGIVAADESRVARVHSRFSGWIERLAVATTGQKVRRGEVLASLYNLELLPAQQELLAARRWSGTEGAAAAGPSGATVAPGVGRLEQDARQRLQLFGMSGAEIDAIEKSGKPARTVAVTAPIAGHVIRKGAVRGTYVEPGTELFEIADLSRVWVLADVYEHEMGRVSVGQAASVLVGAYPDERFSGTVGFVYPTVDPATRTLRVRVELANQQMKLRPGMYGDVVVQLAPAQGVVVPTEALVDTGEFQYVFLARDGGRFEPRRVRVGARSGDKIQILEGVAEGETVVTTANFLVDSESRLRATLDAAPAPGAGP